MLIQWMNDGVYDFERILFPRQCRSVGRASGFENNVSYLEKAGLAFLE
jgi:hypothetical protein